MGPGHLGVALVNLFVLILLFGFVGVVFRLTFSQRPNPGQPKLKALRPLKPKSPAACPFCRAEEPARRQTVLYRLKTHSARVAEALTFLAEGVDVSVLERAWRIRESTVRTWLTRAGLQAQELHARFFQNLRCAHIQLDELWAHVRQAGQDVWVWAAIDATTKIIPVLRLGPRTLHRAYAVVHERHHRLQAGFPLPVFTTDGLRLYFYALTAHFGHWLQPEDARKPVWHA